MNKLHFIIITLLAMITVTSSPIFADNQNGHVGDNAPMKKPVMGQEQAIGSIGTANPYIQAMQPGAKDGAGGVLIVNRGEVPDMLLSASSPRAERVELHKTNKQDSIANSTKLPGGIIAPVSGATPLVPLPGGWFLKFKQVAVPFVKGELVAVTLVFEEAGSAQFVFVVASENAERPDQ